MKVRCLTIHALAALVLAGCSTATTTNPPRSVTEQLLLSTAADRAINGTRLDLFAQKKGFVDSNNFGNYYKLLGFIEWTMTDIPEKKK